MRGVIQFRVRVRLKGTIRCYKPTLGQAHENEISQIRLREGLCVIHLATLETQNGG